MRKLIITLGLFACFFCFYGLGAYMRNYPLSKDGTPYPLRPLVKQQAPITVPPHSKLAPKQANNAIPAKPLAKSVEEDKGAILVERLQAGRLDPFSRLQESLARRFGETYPRNESEALKEAASRLSILQAMNQYKQQTITKTEFQMLAQFYQQKADDEAEHPAVRRESMRNLLQMIGRMDEEDRLKLLSRAGRFLSSASRPTNELMEEIFKVSQP